MIPEIASGLLIFQFIRKNDFYNYKKMFGSFVSCEPLANQNHKVASRPLYGYLTQPTWCPFSVYSCSVAELPSLLNKIRSCRDEKAVGTSILFIRVCYNIFEFFYISKASKILWNQCEQAVLLCSKWLTLLY